LRKTCFATTGIFSRFCERNVTDFHTIGEPPIDTTEFNYLATLVNLIFFGDIFEKLFIFSKIVNF
jgi:hypothetical protein